MEPQHPDVGSSYNILATVLSDQGDLKQAKEYHEPALAIRQQTLGLQHPHVATSYNNIATLYFVIKVTWRKHRSMRSLLMLLFYLAYFVSLLITSDDNENLRTSNRARRKKKICRCLKRKCKDIENLVVYWCNPRQITLWHNSLFRTSSSRFFHRFSFPFPLIPVTVGLKRDHISSTNTSAHSTLNHGGMESTERAFLT